MVKILLQATDAESNAAPFCRIPANAAAQP
jgi:hypothetical protein